MPTTLIKDLPSGTLSHSQSGPESSLQVDRGLLLNGNDINSNFKSSPPDQKPEDLHGPGLLATTEGQKTESSETASSTLGATPGNPDEQNLVINGGGIDNAHSSSNESVRSSPATKETTLAEYGKYMKELESRIKDLESQRDITVISRTNEPSGPTPIMQPRRVYITPGPHPAIALKAVAELKTMTWEDYTVDKGDMMIPQVHYAIDILADEPVIDLGRSRKRSGYGVDYVDSDTSPMSSPRTEGLPSRIRINSQILLHHLFQVSKKGPEPGWVLGRPLVILRPFKMLYYYETDLRNLLESLEAKLAASASDQEDKEAALSPTEENDHKVLTTDGQNSSSNPVPIAKKPQLNGLFTEERLNGAEGISVLRCMIQFIDEYIRPVQDAFDQNRREKVAFSELYHLLKPDPQGKLACAPHKDFIQIWRIIQVTGGRKILRNDLTASGITPPAPAPGILRPPPPANVAPVQMDNMHDYYDGTTPFLVDCEYIDYDGRSFRPVYHRFMIEPFDGEQEIEQLSIFPLEYAKDRGIVDEEVLRERGGKFMNLDEARHKKYVGQSLVQWPTARPLTDRQGVQVEPMSVDSEVMIDFKRTLAIHRHWAHPPVSLLSCASMDRRECLEGEKPELIDKDYEWDKQMRVEVTAAVRKAHKYSSSKDQPMGDDILLLPQRVFGYILRTRKWAALDVNKLEDVAQQEDPFSFLELPVGHKGMVQALVHSYLGRKARETDPGQKELDDLYDPVGNKGKGLVILLHGAPGVGKTSTAECVAKSHNRPLLPITCGDLGTSPQQVEETLEKLFALAGAWQCVLLLDEADVFMSRRSSSDLQRNAIVSVFLRVLEYYDGILILTTNRIGDLDEAFKSRIHIALHYPPLEKGQTKKIWRSHIRRIEKSLKGRIEIDEDLLMDYVKKHFDAQEELELNAESGGARWNGRQIRNAFQSAIALALYEAKDSPKINLEVEHFRKVAKVASDFDDYLFQTHNKRSHDEIARDEFLRAPLNT